MILCREPSREEVSQPFLKPYSVSDSVRSTAFIGCFHTYATTTFHTLSLILLEGIVLTLLCTLLPSPCCQWPHLFLLILTG